MVRLIAAVLKKRAVVTNVGNVGICYDPMHNTAYPIGYEWFFKDKLRAAINADFVEMAKYATNVRTYYSQYYRIPVAEYAAMYGLMLDLGVFMTAADWQHAEIEAAIAAIQTYPNAIETVLVGNENLQNGVNPADTIGIVNPIKTTVGPVAAARVKFGTVQRITDYVTSTYDAETTTLSANLDLLGVNIYPFFATSHDDVYPTALLDAQWNQMAAKFPANKMRLTETGFATTGSPSVSPPSAQPSVSSSVTYSTRLWLGRHLPVTLRSPSSGSECSTAARTKTRSMTNSSAISASSRLIAKPKPPISRTPRQRSAPRRSTEAVGARVKAFSAAQRDNTA